MKNNNERLHSLFKPIENDEIVQNILGSLIGGRVEMKYGIYKGDFVQLDINSLYPYVMMNHIYPIGKETIHKNNGERIFKNKNRIGIYEVIVDYSESTNNVAILPSLLNNKRSWDIKYIKTQVDTLWLTDNMIQLLIENNVDVIFTGRGVSWKKLSYSVFNEFIFNLYSLRSTNKIENKIIKTVMNSISGKFLQDKKYSYISIFIYSYAREYMFRNFLNKVKYYYTDTDSLIISKNQLNNLSEFIGTNIGQLKIENESSVMYLLKKKMYLLLNDKNEVVKSKISGVSQRAKFIYNGIEYTLGIETSINRLYYFTTLLNEKHIFVKYFQIDNEYEYGYLNKFETIKEIKFDEDEE